MKPRARSFAAVRVVLPAVAAFFPFLAFVVVLGRAEPASATPSPAPGAAPGPATTAPPTGAAPAASPSPAVKAEARERFDTGLHLFEKGENAGALAEFKRAYQLIPTPVVLYNMGLVYAAMNRPVDALDALTQFLSEPEGAGAEQKKHAEQVRAEQEKRIAQLVVLTDHPATVEVDGVEVGHTPLAKPIRVGSGSHVVAVEAPGFLGSRREVTLAGQLTETIAMSMQPTDTRMAQLVVTTALPGAEVVVNGKRVGATPLPASIAVPPGKVTVEIQRAGYLTASQTISLDEGARGEVKLTLEEDPAAPTSVKGRLVVTASEAGAELSIDGGARRTLTGAVSLPVGPHHVHLEKLGYEPVERSVEVVNGQDASLLVTLTPTSELAAQLAASRHSRKVVGWSLVAGGAAIAITGGVLAVLGNSALPGARADFKDKVTSHETTIGDPCYAGEPLGDFTGRGCDGVHSYWQGRIDSDETKRLVGILGGAAGLVTAAIGTYLLVTDGTAPASGVTNVALWADGDSAGGVILGGRF